MANSHTQYQNPIQNKGDFKRRKRDEKEEVKDEHKKREKSELRKSLRGGGSIFYLREMIYRRLNL